LIGKKGLDDMTRLAFVTGGNKGIGRGIVEMLVKEGYKVAFSYNNGADSADRLLNDLSQHDTQIMTVQMSVENRDSVRTALRKIEMEMGNIDILVNNAGMAQEKPFDTISDEDWNELLGVNLRGPFSVVQELLPHMVKNNWGRIINISSIGGQWGGFNQVHYAASKAALINFTQSIAKIYSQHGITSNALAPGLIATDMSEAELQTEAGKKKVEGIPVKRLGTVEDVGSAILYLSSDHASYVTGQTINLNGGMLFST
jgi:NAD(P)-dependent dehydrogenase (short-subunit alcohol dehydrogenase family)